MFEKRAHTPVEQRNYAWLYLAFSGVLFLGTVWAVWDEVKTRRPWKEYQAEYYVRAANALDSLRQVALSNIDSVEVSMLEASLRDAQARMESEEYRNAVEARRLLLLDLDIATREWRFARSRSDASYYQLQKARLEGVDDSALKAEVRGHEAAIENYAAQMEELNTKVAEFNTVINSYIDAVTEIQAALTRIKLEVSALELKMERVRSAPIEVKQVVITDFEYTPFQEVKARVDRCQTCHLGWSDALMVDAPQPYTLHPLPDLLSKHNPETFGCSPCHRGQGPALTTGFAHGDDDHYWETPLLRGVDVYASCNSCHASESVLTYAKPFTKAKQLLIENGCYGCHAVNGYNDMPKIGPPLNTLNAKVAPEWIYRWVKNPKDYNPHTRMPSFELSDDEAEAVTAYLVNVGSKARFQLQRARGAAAGGSVATGKKIFETVGCIACHVVGDQTNIRDSRGTSYDIAPELTRVGSKVSAEWMFDWIKNPRHYNPDARMPNLRLTDDEARHVVAYLMTQRDPQALSSRNLDLTNPEVIARGDKLIREYGCAGCHAINGMENEGKVSVDLSDFGRKKVEQMDFGNIRALPHGATSDYVVDANGNIAVGHTWSGWVTGKLKNSRLYATERIPQKMPLFNFNDEEVALLKMLLLSMTKDVPVARYQRAFDRRQQDIEAGRRLSIRYNCIQCHAIEDRGGDVLVRYEEEALGPPKLTATQGAKVQEPWLHDFLKSPSTIRPWLDIRMPTFAFTDDEISIVTKYFLGLSKQELKLRNYAATPVEQEYLASGKKLFEVYQCAKCHPTGPVRGGELSASDLAPDLAMASTRLKPEWIIDWLHDPNKLQPGTRMPAFFYEGKGPDYSIYEGDAELQIKALKTYVWSLGRNRRPLSSLSN